MVRVERWKTDRSWMVYVLITWPSGGKLRDRKVVKDKTEKQALKWGQDREHELIQKGEKKVEEEKAVPKGSAISVTDWYRKYHEHAEAGTVGRKNQGKGQAAIQDRRDRLRLWIAPIIGDLLMHQVTAEHMRKLVKSLDDQVRRRIKFYEDGAEDDDRVVRNGKLMKPGLSSKTAQHIWSECTSGFREAVSSKLDELRVLRIDPTSGVQPPIRTKPREQEALFPSEVVQLVSCEDIPLHRRRLYTVAIYTGMRRSELERLTAAHVNLEHETVTVVGSKSDAATRQVPIEPALLPLLTKLVEERKKGPLLDVPSGQGTHGTADLIRLDMEKAKVTRAALQQNDAHVMPFTFHGCRHTAITHWAVAGKSQLFLLTVAGHMDPTMTKRYLGKAASVSAKFGKPHPPLPASLLGGAEVVRLTSKRTG